ncbi:MAG: hypothetical protein WCF30_03975 [Terracidiphilus sp.]
MATKKTAPKKSTKKTKKKSVQHVVLDTVKRKKNPPSTAYSASNPSPVQFQPGSSPNPGGKVREDRSFRKCAIRRSGQRAPNAAAIAVGLKPGASWNEVAIEAQFIRAATGDTDAATFLKDLIDGARPGGRFFGFTYSETDTEDTQSPVDGVAAVMARCDFIPSDGAGYFAESYLLQHPECIAREWAHISPVVKAKLAFFDPSLQLPVANVTSADNEAPSAALPAPSNDGDSGRVTPHPDPGDAS